MHPFLQAATMVVQQAQMLGFLQVICFSDQSEVINLWCNKSMNRYLQASLKRGNSLTQQ